MFLQNAIADALATGALLSTLGLLWIILWRTKITGYVLAPIPETTDIS
tara:strand:+ start:142 stop:285 length:144 start_codon:yes stop_codon:yes gene_type:complete